MDFITVAIDMEKLYIERFKMETWIQGFYAYS